MAAPTEDVEQVFQRYDSDGSGSIDPKELTKALREVGIEVDMAMAKKVMQGYDSDGSEGLGVDEFKKLVVELRKYQAAQPQPAKAEQPDDDITQIFRKFDADHTGSIEIKELTKALVELNLDVNGDEAKAVIQGFDADGSGGLQPEEFRKLVTKLREFQARQPPKRDDRPRVAALSKHVAKNKYLPKFQSKKSVDQEKKGSFLEYMAKMEKATAKQTADAQAKKNKRKKKGNADQKKEEEGGLDVDAEAWYSLLFTIAITLLLTLMEAFDIDVLIGFAMMPFITAMKWLAKEFDNDHLDPTIWAKNFGKGSSQFAQHHPLGFVVVDFGLFAIGVTYFLFEADLNKWWATRKMREQGYDSLEDDENASPMGGFLSKVATDPDELQVLLAKATEDLEEHDLVVKLRGSVDVDEMNDMAVRRARIQNQIDTYNRFLSAIETEKAEAVDLEELAAAAAAAEAKKAREGGCSDTTKLVVTIIKNAIAGFITIWLYFMDLISDYQVTTASQLTRASLNLLRELDRLTAPATSLTGDNALLQCRSLPLRFCLRLPPRRPICRRLDPRTSLPA